MSTGAAKPSGSAVEQELSMPYLYCSMPVKQLIRPPVKRNWPSYWLQPLALGLVVPLQSCSNCRKDITFLFFVFSFSICMCGEPSRETRDQTPWPAPLRPIGATIARGVFATQACQVSEDGHEVKWKHLLMAESFNWHVTSPHLLDTLCVQMFFCFSECFHFK